MRRLGICAFIVTVCAIAVTSGGSGAQPSSASAAPATAAAKKKCRKGYVRKRVRGKVRCVKRKRVVRPPAPTAAPPAPARVTDPAQVKHKLAGTLWFWTHTDQAGSGGTTDRTHVNLCADGTYRLRRSSSTSDGQGNSHTVIIEDLAPAWDVTSGYFDPATGDVEARVTATSNQRRVRTASGAEHSEPNEALAVTLSRKGGVATMDGLPAYLLDEPPLCTFE